MHSERTFANITENLPVLDAATEYLTEKGVINCDRR